MMRVCFGTAVNRWENCGKTTRAVQFWGFQLELEIQEAQE
jgi:hypothetical protein